MITTNYTNFRKNLKSYLDRVSDDADNLIIDRGNGKNVVVISQEEYEAMLETVYLMNSQKVMTDIAEGEKAVAEGNFIKWKPDEV